MTTVVPSDVESESPLLAAIPGASSASQVPIPFGVVIGAALFTGCGLAAVFRQQAWEFPVIHAFNAVAGRFALLDRGIYVLTSRDLLQGAVFVALIWYLWFDTVEVGVRGRLLTGALAATLAGALSRLLQIVLPTHLRPLHTPSLGFVMPIGVEPDTLNHFDAFPSDHGALLFGLAFVVYRLRPRLGVAAIVWATIVNVGRIYEGYHYPSDVVGSIGLALIVVSMFDNRWSAHLAQRLLVLERVRRPAFYLLAFLVTYQIATLFDDVREIGRDFAHVVLHHEETQDISGSRSGILNCRCRLP
jgi:undecaprenyl-diphosphatase